MIAYLYDICRKNQPSFSQAYTAYKIHAPHYTYIYIYTHTVSLMRLLMVISSPIPIIHSQRQRKEKRINMQITFLINY